MGGLDDRCIGHLESFPQLVQDTVIARFEHRPDQTNASARCVAFAKSVASSQGAQHPVDPLAQFQANWGLDAKCMDYLSTLSPEVQGIVMTQFDHKPHQTNPSARCMAF